MYSEVKGNPRKIPYSVYLETTHWKRLREKVLTLDKGRCVRCTKKAREVHHRTYVRLGREDIQDVVSVCGTCHVHIHSGALKIDEVRRKKAKTTNKWKKWQHEKTRRIETYIKVRKCVARLIREHGGGSLEIVALRKVMLAEGIISRTRIGKKALPILKEKLRVLEAAPKGRRYK